MADLAVKPAEVLKKKRIRPRTKAIRIDLKNKIETALLHKKSPILQLFKESVGTDLSASLDEVLLHLGYDEKSPVRKLTKHQLRSISNKSRVFNIIGTNDEPLKLVFDSRNRENLEDKTVYVDNLPLSCSSDQLKRRASIFGTVVSINMPVVNRLRRRHCLGVDQPLNSGFAFVQFSSKTAVRRFCKRYIANCHLNRTHHPKTHRKRKGQLNSSTIGASASTTLNASTTQVDQATLPNESSSSQPRLPNSAERKRRSTEVSISAFDSGTESDFAKPEPKSKTEVAGVEVKKKKRKRRRKTPLIAFSLTKFLSKLQVFPYPKYKELRQEYIKMKNTNLKALKDDLRDRDLIQCNESDLENIDFTGRGIAPQPRKRKRPRRQHDVGTSQPRRKSRRSRANVIKVATRLKDESFAIPYNENPY